MRIISKMPEYPFVLVPFPLAPVGVWSDEEIESLCDDLIPQIIDQLTKPVAGGRS
jgi:hypothetical protein